jgi:hypothetical protein
MNLIDVDQNKKLNKKKTNKIKIVIESQNTS